jgi:xylulokinase
MTLPPEDKLVLAIDLGTSGPKVALANSRGQILAHEFAPNTVYYLPHGGAEQDPEDWWRAIKTATAALLARHEDKRSRIAALCCTTQWSGTVAVGAGGTPLMNAIIWLDSRGAPYVHEIAGRTVRIQGYGPGKLWKWLRLTGGAPSASGKDPIAHILFLKHERPDIYARTHKFLEPKDYLNFRLTGRLVSTYDTIALHWVTDNRDPDRVDYDAGLLAMSSIERDKLPDLVRAVDLLGPVKPEVAEELGLPPFVQVAGGTPDIHSAAIGAGAIQPFAGHIYIGTSSWLTCHVPFKKTDILHNMTSLPSAIPGRYLLVNEQETAGGCLSFLRDRLFFPDDGLTGAPPADVYKRFDMLAAEAPPGSGKLIFTPWLYGERTPIEDHTVRGGFFNLSLQTTRLHMIRAVMEGVAYNSRWLLGCVEKYTGRKFDALNMIGGGASSRVWCQIMADVLDRPIRQVNDPIQANARGAALLGAVAMGWTSFDEAAGEITIRETFHPRPENRTIYDELFAEFTHIYKANRPIYARLNRKP